MPERNIAQPRRDRALSTHVLTPAQTFAVESRSASTRRGYATDYRIWTEWCARRGCSPMPATPQDLGDFLAEEAATHKPGTLERRLASISVAHRSAGFDSPTRTEYVHSVLMGIRRQYGTAQRQKTPILLDDLLAAVATCENTLEGLRDRAVLSVAWAGAFRRAEVAALTFEDMEFDDEGITMLLRFSKTDQEGRGRSVGLPHASTPETQPVCPPCNIGLWVTAARISSGPIFRRVSGGRAGGGLTGQSVATVIQKRMRRAGLAGDWGGHSARAGLVTQAGLNDVDVHTIMQTTGHRRVDQVMSYMRDTDLYRKNAAKGAGL